MNAKRVAVRGGLDPIHLLEKIVRDRIIDSLYWKEQCFALNEETLVDRAVQLQYIGGLYGNQRPSPFLCLLYKLLELQPDKDVILAFIQQEEHKYLRCLAIVYWRMIAPSRDVYSIIEPFLSDYRKLRCRSPNGFHLTFMDQVVDDLLIEERFFDITLPYLQKRELLEKVEALPLYISPLALSDSETETD